jgi:hypothetical protein
VQGDVAAAAGEIVADHRRDILIAAEAARGDSGLAADLDALIVAAQHEVDDAGDGVRTVDGRIAAGDDVDPLDQVVRNRIDVRRDGVVQDVGGDVAAAVDEHERAERAEAAQIEQVEARNADAGARILLGIGAAQLGQVVQRVADIGVALLEEGVAADRGDRNRGFEVGAADARAGDDDRGARIGGLLGRRLVGCRLGVGGLGAGGLGRAGDRGGRGQLDPRGRAGVALGGVGRVRAIGGLGGLLGEGRRGEEADGKGRGRSRAQAPEADGEHLYHSPVRQIVRLVPLHRRRGAPSRPGALRTFSRKLVAEKAQREARMRASLGVSGSLADSLS